MLSRPASSILFRLVLGATAAAGVAAVAPACASTTSSSACDDSKCLPGNKCLPLAGKIDCRRTCASNSDPTTSCPAGYTCVSESPTPFCVADTTGLTTIAKGQFGASCNASGGQDANPDCDTAHQFGCFAETPTDGAAYCTRFACTTDRDCAAGFWCAQVNSSPNADTTTRTIGDVEKVCIKRNYCAPCTADLDCPDIPGSPPLKQHCQNDGVTGATFCTPECQTSDNCNNEAKCFDTGSGYKVCFPRAGACVGDGSICSPCLSDADCGDDGACVKGQFTTERSCAKKSKITCATDGTTTAGKSFDCPPLPAGVPNKEGCFGFEVSEVPVDYCHGFYILGGNSLDIGCYTPNR